MQSYPATTAATELNVRNHKYCSRWRVRCRPAHDGRPVRPGLLHSRPSQAGRVHCAFPAPRVSAGQPEPPLRILALYAASAAIAEACGRSEGDTSRTRFSASGRKRCAKPKRATPRSQLEGDQVQGDQGISWAVDRTTSADLDFITRIPEDDKKKDEKHSSDDEHDHVEGDHTGRTVKLEQMVLVYRPH